MAKQRIKVEDLYRFKLVGDPQCSPDGSQTCFVVETMDKKDKAYYTTLYMVENTGRKPRALTHGKRNDRNPRWAPDGSCIAFLRKKDHGDQLWILPMNGGEAYTLTNLKRGAIGDIVWSPDGNSIAFLYHPMGKEKKVKDDGSIETPVARHIDRLWYRLDGYGFFDSEYTHLWVANARTGQAKQLVDGKFNDSFPAWTPDSKELVFISNRFEDWEHRIEENCLYRVSATGSDVMEIPAPEGPKEGLTVSPDGQRLAYLGHQTPYHSWGAINYTLNIIDMDGSGHKSIGSSLDRTAYPLTLGDLTPSFLLTSPVWASDAKSVYYMIAGEGRQWLMKGDIQGGIVERISQEEDVVVSFSFNREKTICSFQNASLDSPDELYCMNMDTGKTRKLTGLNRAYINQRAFHIPEEIWFNNGDQRLQGWLVKPPDFDASKKYPLILNIHGGPRCQYGRTFFHEMLTFASNGYVVLYTNPRGSQGYGMEFADAITACWAEPAMGDLMAGVNTVVSMGFIDKSRMGVTGGSYGGYMTNWIVTHSNAFAAAVTQRSVSDLSSMFGNSDIGWDMHYEFGGSPWDNHDTYRKWSPITYIEKCHTPLLVVHSEQDLRCNIEQGDQMYMALKYLKRDTEYVRFPEEPHGLSRHGRPDRREKRLSVIIDWFDKYLKS